MIVTQIPDSVQASTSKLSQPLSAQATILSRRQCSRNVTVNAIGHERQYGIRIGGASLQFHARPSRAIRIGIDKSDRRKLCQRLGMRPICDEDAWLLRDHFNCLRSQAPSQSTTITHIKIVSRIADTWSYRMMRKAAISSKPMPPAPTIPSTVDARK